MIQVQELVDLTIDFLHDSPEDLKRCSLVCRSWLDTAQYHLFAYFALENEGECERLRDILEESPHLLRLITHISIAFPSRVATLAYGALSKIHFTHLRQLTIFTLPSETTMSALQNLVAIPSVAHIRVLQTPDATWLLFFLQRSASLQTLAIDSRTYRDDGRWTRDDQFVFPAPSNRFQLDCLRLSKTDIHTIAKNLDNPLISPFDLSAMRRLVLLEECANIPTLTTILQKVGSSLADLEINGVLADHPDTFGKLDIGPTVLPRLIHFTFHIFSPSALPVIPALLVRITTGAPLRRVTLVVSRDCAPSAMDLSLFAHARYWEAIDAVIAGLSSVSLTVRVLLTASGAMESQAGIVELQGCLPRLATTRSLKVVATL
ncbi:hypothetical protein C8R43DRAFT_570014 [Mycena crocata]|nr:hypothetical protein C8R43DRAFT_570014 [Mycena crocata]